MLQPTRQTHRHAHTCDLHTRSERAHTRLCQRPLVPSTRGRLVAVRATISTVIPGLFRCYPCKVVTKRLALQMSANSIEGMRREVEQVCDNWFWVCILGGGPSAPKHRHHREEGWADGQSSNERATSGA